MTITAGHPRWCGPDGWSTAAAPRPANGRNDIQPSIMQAGGVIVRFSGRKPCLRSAIPVTEGEGNGLVLDATKLTWASPLDLTGIAAWASAGPPSETSLFLPEEPELASYLNRMDVLRSLKEQGVAIHGAFPSEIRQDLTDRLIEVRRICEDGDLQLFASDVFHLVQSNVGDHAARLVHSLLGELLDNVARHAKSTVGAFGAAQVYTGATTGRPGIEISVADPGQGILASLRSNPRFSTLSDCLSAIRASLKPGVTGDVDGVDLPGHGNGLPRIVGQLRAHRGRLLLRSGNGIARVATSQRVASVPVSVPGTWAWMRLDSQNGQLAG